MNLRGDARGVSELLGAILVFGLVVTVLAVFQVNAVPANNAAVEFTHDQAAQSDFQLVRTAIVEAAGSNEPRSAAVDLGVTYPNRLLFVNPGPVAGNLRTVDAGAYEALDADDVNLSQICGFGTGDSQVETKSLDYSVDYNVYAGDPVLSYENTVVHQRYANSDVDLVRNDQRLVTGNTISLFPLVGDADYSGTNSQSIDFVSGGTSLATRTIDDPWTLVVPTALEAATWANSERLLKGEANVLGATTVDDDHVAVRMKAGTYTFRCTVVGVNEPPTGVTPIDETDGDEDDSGEINPVTDGTLRYVDATVNPGDKDTPTSVTITWENRGDADITVTAVRIPFYDADGQGSSGGTPATDGAIVGFGAPTFDVGGSYVELPGGVEVGKADGVSYSEFELTVAFLDKNGNPYDPGAGDYFAVVLEAEVDGTTDRNTYFVAPDGGKSGNRNK